MVLRQAKDLTSLSGAPLADLVDAAIATNEASGSSSYADGAGPMNSLIDRAMLLAESEDNSSLRSALHGLRGELATAVSEANGSNTNYGCRRPCPRRRAF